MPAKQTKGTPLETARHGDTTIKVGDCLLINPDAAQSGTPYIGKVLAIIKPDNGDEIQLKVNWFYRPEEAVGGRKAFHGEKELFLSDHQDECSVLTVIQHCRVMSLTRYQELQRIGEHDYYARFTYRPGTKVFEPPKVPVFCTCEMPYNPDKFMVMCDSCQEWYHPECLKSTKKELTARANWRCPDCVAADAPQQSLSAGARPGDKRSRADD